MKTALRVTSAIAAVILSSASAFAQQATVPTTMASTQQTAATMSAALGGAVSLDSHAVSNVGGTEYAVSSAVAPPIAVSAGTCAISTSAAVQAMKVGFAAGHAYVVGFCERLQKAAALNNMNQPRAAIAMLCADDDDVRYAIAAQGGVTFSVPTGETRQEPTGQMKQVPTSTKGVMLEVPVMRTVAVMKQVTVDCPMSQKAWIEAGRPKLDPITGQAIPNTGEHAQVAATSGQAQVYVIAQTTSAGQSNNTQTVNRETYLRDSVYGKSAPADTQTAASSPKPSDYELDKSDGSNDGKLRLIN